MQKASFTCPLPPSVNSYLGKRVAYNPITKRPFVQVYETKEAKDFKKHMAKVLERTRKESGWIKTGEYQYVICQMDVYLSQKKRDTDNLFKCLLDCLTENDFVYDDSMVIPRVNNVFIQADDPRVEVTIYPSSKVGTFTDHWQLYQFEQANCVSCNRFSRNCSIRREATENRIRSEIDMESNSCSSKKERSK